MDILDFYGLDTVMPEFWPESTTTAEIGVLKRNKSEMLDLLSPSSEHGNETVEMINLNEGDPLDVIPKQYDYII